MSGKAMAHIEDPQIAAVTALSESSDDGGPKAVLRRKRSRSLGIRKQAPVDDVVRVQRMLAKKTAKCKADCKHHFRTKVGQRELLQFRAEWTQLHKTDQDELVLGHGMASLTFNFVVRTDVGFLSSALRFLLASSRALPPRYSNVSMMFGMLQRGRRGAGHNGNF